MAFFLIQIGNGELDFFAFNQSQEIAFEVTRPSEEFVFRLPVWKLEASRFVNEYTQCCVCHKNRKWRGSLPVTHGEELAPLLEDPD